MKMRAGIVIDFLLVFLFVWAAVDGALLANGILPEGFDQRHDFEVFHGMLAAGGVMLLIVHILLHKRKRKGQK